MWVSWCAHTQKTPKTMVQILTPAPRDPHTQKPSDQTEGNFIIEPSRFCQLLSRPKVFPYSRREVLQLSEEELGILLQIYLASYSLYAVLLLTGALGSLTVLQLRVTMKKGRLVFAVAYWTLVGIVWFSLLRLLQYSKSIDTISQRLNLANLELELQADEVWFYYIFRWVFQNMYPIIIVVVGLTFLLFLVMWVEVEKSAKCGSGA